jgi:hypothetical protein
MEEFIVRERFRLKRTGSRASNHRVSGRCRDRKRGNGSREEAGWSGREGVGRAECDGCREEGKVAGESVAAGEVKPGDKGSRLELGEEGEDPCEAEGGLGG